MPLPADLALLLIVATALGLGLVAVLSQAVGGALGALVLSQRPARPGLALRPWMRGAGRAR